MTRLRKTALAVLSAAEIALVALMVGVLFLVESLHTFIAGGTHD